MAGKRSGIVLRAKSEEITHKYKTLGKFVFDYIMNYGFVTSCLAILIIGFIPIYEGFLHEPITSIMLISLVFVIPQLFEFEPLLKLVELVRIILRPKLKNKQINKIYKNLSNFFKNEPYNVGLGLTIIFMAYILIARLNTGTIDTFDAGLFFIGIAFYFNDIYQWLVVRH